MKPNQMKEKMLRGEPAFGCSVMFPSAQIVEMLGYAGFDLAAPAMRVGGIASR